MRVTRIPDRIVAGNRAKGATRSIEPSYERVTFDRAVASAAPTGRTPQAELCGPGHPLFDALVADASVAYTGALERGSVLADPDTTEPYLAMLLAGEVVDGSGQIATKRLVTVRTDPSGRQSELRYPSLYDLGIPEDDSPRVPDAPVEVPGLAESSDWARAEVFEADYLTAAERATRIARTQEEFLRRSFARIDAAAQEAIMDAEDDVAAGKPGAEGGCAKPTRACHETPPPRNTPSRVRLALRPSVWVTSPMSRAASSSRLDRRRDERLSKDEIELIAMGVAMDYERARHPAIEVEDVSAQRGLGFDVRSALGSERRCIEVKGRIWCRRRGTDLD